MGQAATDATSGCGNRIIFFVSLPETFTLSFAEFENTVQVFIDGRPCGNAITDNSYDSDFYRYHDIFHYAFATLLGDTPCATALFTNQATDKRETLLEEAISLIIFSEAKRKNYFDRQNISRRMLRLILDLTEESKSLRHDTSAWENAIMKAYEIFRLLIQHRGGIVYCDRLAKTISYKRLSKLHAHSTQRYIQRMAR